jgi:hypothetical protein
MRTLLLLFAYVVSFALLLVVSIAITRRDPPSDPVLAAKKELPFNHLIVERDLKQASWLRGQVLPVEKAPFIGRYASGSIAKGQLLRARELNSQPILRPDPNAVRLVAAANAADVLSGELNAEIDAKLCADRVGPHPVKTVAVFCAPGVEEPCSAIADIDPKLAATLKGPIAILPALTATCN